MGKFFLGVLTGVAGTVTVSVIGKNLYRKMTDFYSITVYTVLCPFDHNLLIPFWKAFMSEKERICSQRFKGLSAAVSIIT